MRGVVEGGLQEIWKKIEVEPPKNEVESKIFSGPPNFFLSPNQMPGTSTVAWKYILVGGLMVPEFWILRSKFFSPIS